MRPRQEQTIEAFCHFSNAIPIWGIFFCGVVAFWLREESREVTRQAREAMIFHCFILTALLVWSLVDQIIRLMRLLLPMLLCDILHWSNNVLMFLLYAAFAAICVWGAGRRLQGEPFHYPFPRGSH